jgi:hypothetical protein
MSSENSILPVSQRSMGEGFGKDTGLDYRWWHSWDNRGHIDTAKRSLYQELHAYPGCLLFQAIRPGASRNSARFDRPNPSSAGCFDSAGWTASNSGRVSRPVEAQAVGENIDRARRRDGVYWDRDNYGLRRIRNWHFLSFYARPILDWDRDSEHRKIPRLELPGAL